MPAEKGLELLSSTHQIDVKADGCGLFVDGKMFALLQRRRAIGKRTGRNVPDIFGGESAVPCQEIRRVHHGIGNLDTRILFTVIGHVDGVAPDTALFA